MFNNSLRNQIILYCAAIVLVTSTIALASFWWSTTTFNENNIAKSINTAKNVYQQYMAAKENLLVTSAKVLTADFGFKQAVATNDADTITSVLSNHGMRISADLMILTDLNGNLVSSSSNAFTANDNMSSLVNELLEYPVSAKFVLLNNTLYQTILLPVKAPHIIAYTLIGFKINQQVTSELKQLTGIEVSFIIGDEKVVSSSLETQDAHDDIYQYFWQYREPGLLGSRVGYSNRIISLSGLKDTPVAMLLSASLAKTYAEFDNMLQTFLILVCITMLLCIVLSGVLSKKLTEPLLRLVKIARQFSEGNYFSEFKGGKTSTEIKDLFNAFSEMGTEIQQRESQILYQAQHDTLTGLYNRNSMSDIINEVLITESQFLLLVIDIKGLKHINDKLGPQIGDNCIQAVAQRLLSFSYHKNMIHARIGGDEFLSILPLGKTKSREQLVNDVLKLLSTPYAVHDLDLTLGFSCGAAQFPVDGEDAKLLLRRATIASDAASNTNVSMRFYQAGEDEAHLQRIAIVEELKQALEDDDGALFMHYQPKLHTQSGKIHKVEALMRWINKEGKFVPPDLFIDLAERAGLIISLTHWVIDSVVKQIAIWKELDVNIEVAINVSAQDLMHDAFSPTLLQVLNKYQVEPSQITIELTERDMMENEQKGIAAITELKNAGFTISVDDYGIGQSSLSKLRQLPLHELKIDKSFILELDTSPDDQTIVKSTITLGHNLGLTVVAEGVENEASLNLLKDMGCDQIQGYFLSRPLSADALVSWLEEYKNA
ncbi:EAL domain-containing protein [Alteromonadaceae bacterium BrNp21-10]|nr:EAL domain-containing protein [Alteromonadaceae bacterium BrNp21-10]